MAVLASASPPVFLLFDYLLASSWTWLALCVATIATTLRALRLRLARRRLLTLAPDAASPAAPTASSSSDPSAGIQPFSRDPSRPSISLQRNFKRRPGSKSTSSLENLRHSSREDFCISGVQFLSSVFDPEIPSSLKKISSASKISHGQQASADAQQRPGLHATGPSRQKETANASLSEDCKVPFERVWGSAKADRFWASTNCPCEMAAEEENEQEFRRASSERQMMCSDEDALSCPLIPSWALSLCGSSQLRSWPSNFDADSHGLPPHLVSPCFLKQFGWDKLLESKLGFPWSFRPSLILGPMRQQHVSPMERSSIVRTWDAQQKKVLRKLDLDEGSMLTLDACVPQGLACTGNRVGEVSMWDLERKACATGVAEFVKPVLALSMNLEQHTTVVGSAAGIGLWDPRSSSKCSFNAISMPSPSLSGLKSRGSGFCVATDDGLLSMYDLRKLHGSPPTSPVLVKRHQKLAASVDDFETLERFTCNTEDDVEVDGDLAMVVNGVDLRNASSLMSRLTTFVQAVVAFMS